MPFANRATMKGVFRRNEQSRLGLSWRRTGHERIRRNFLAVFANMPAFLAALTSEKSTLLPEVSSLAPGAKRTN
jgi:hypothetical protein